VSAGPSRARWRVGDAGTTLSLYSTRTPTTAPASVSALHSPSIVRLDFAEAIEQPRDLLRTPFVCAARLCRACPDFEGSKPRCDPGASEGNINDRSNATLRWQALVIIRGHVDWIIAPQTVKAKFTGMIRHGRPGARDASRVPWARPTSEGWQMIRGVGDRTPRRANTW
jgi:hypothetical protein